MQEDFKKGDRLSASWVINVNKELQLLRKITGAGGLRVSYNPGGISIGLTEVAGSQMAMMQTIAGPNSTAYPNPDGVFPGQYYARKVSTGTFTEAVGGTSATITYGDNVYVYNKGNGFIPVSTLILCLKINNRWWTLYDNTGPEIVEGILTSALVANGTALMDVYSEVGGWHNTAKQVTVKDRSGYSGTAGMYCMAVKIKPYGTTYRVLDLGCTG